jgi:hypothetical protein
LIDTAVASASFPWITPSLRLQIGSSSYVSLVDGGYLDNSGAETVSDVLAELMGINIHGDDITLKDVRYPTSHTTATELNKCIERGGNVIIRYLVPKESASEDAFSDCELAITVHALIIRGEAPRDRYAHGQNFFFDPLTALLNTRQRRGETARYGLLGVLCQSPVCRFPAGHVNEWNYFESVIDATFLTLPLGWDIPEARLDLMYQSIVPADDQKDDQEEGQGEGQGEDQEDADVPKPKLTGTIFQLIDMMASPFGTMEDNSDSTKAIEKIFELPASPTK